MQQGVNRIGLPVVQEDFRVLVCEHLLAKDELGESPCRP
jgi:hypothetical protein